MIRPARRRSPEGFPVLLYPPLISRIAGVLTFGGLPLLMGYSAYAESTSNTAASATTPFELLLSSLLTCLLVVIFGYLTWRAWRLGVRLTPSSVIIQGIFYDRKIPLTSVEDVSLGFIAWSDSSGRFRSSLAIAFADPTPVIAFIDTHNRRSLERIRRHALTDSAAGDSQWEDSTSSWVEGRAYDRPESRRPRRSDAGKRAGRGGLVFDVWPSVLLLTILILGSVAGFLFTIGPALYYFNLAPTPSTFRLSYSDDPYNADDIWDLVTLVGPITIILTGAAARLAYLMFRPHLRG